jgi:hypothetical protein
MLEASTWKLARSQKAAEISNIAEHSRRRTKIEQIKPVIQRRTFSFI